MSQPIFTKMFWVSLIASFVGAVFALSPFIWSLMSLDVHPPSGYGSKQITYFGFFEFDYTISILLLREAILAGIALGVASAISYVETRIDGTNLGSWAGGFSASSMVGCLVLIILFIGIIQQGVSPQQYNDSFVKYVKASYVIFIALIITYFASILQVRRVKDLQSGQKHG